MDDVYDHPTLTPAGAQMLRRIREHRHAPRLHNRTGSRLSQAELATVMERAAQLRTAPVDSSDAPGWLPDFLAHAGRCVPFWRGRIWSPELRALPTTSRADLAAGITRFIPDDVPAAGLIVYETSGVTGHPMIVPSHPVVAALYLAVHQRALDRVGVELPVGPAHVAALLIGMQARCFTYASVLPMLGEAGFAKINLHPNDWRVPEDRAAFIDDLAPAVIGGDPVSFSELLALPTVHRPAALLSTSMALSHGLAARLAQRYRCPVLDLYSLNEAGPVAVRDGRVDGHVVCQPGMVVEVVDGGGRRLPDGERGEITLTGGFNHCLPLVRYRTGDHASLRTERIDGAAHRVLVGLTGRRPIRFLTVDGRWINNHEVGHAIATVPLPQFSFHQRADGSGLLVHQGAEPDGRRAGELIGALLGVPVHVGPAEAGVAAVGAKLVQYSSDVDGAEVG